MNGEKCDRCHVITEQQMNIHAYTTIQHADVCKIYNMQVFHFMNND